MFSVVKDDLNFKQNFYNSNICFTKNLISDFVSVNNLVLINKVNTLLNPNECSLSNETRLLLNLAYLDTAKITEYIPTEDYIYEVELNLGNNTTNIILDYFLFEQYFKSTFKVINTNQTIKFIFDNYSIWCKVKSIRTTNNEFLKSILTNSPNLELIKNNNVGILTDKTIIKIGDNLTDRGKITFNNYKKEIITTDINLDNLGIGGLNSQFNEIFRRAFLSRTLPSIIFEKYGMKHVKGILLYGEPGCGKTLIARKISEILKAKTIQIVNGSEVFDKYVGGSEEKIRKLFKPAEEDQNSFHVVIFDEFEVIANIRGSKSDNTGTRDSVVNQLLSKIDGVNSLNNILIIALTNRKDMIDTALLRSGRFEVHIYIGLPDLKGREEILKIHTKNIYNNKLIKTDNYELLLKNIALKTENFSGAELEGVIRNTVSFALNKVITKENYNKVSNYDILIEENDFYNAVNNTNSLFGKTQKDLLKSLVEIYKTNDYEYMYDKINQSLKNYPSLNKSILITNDKATLTIAYLVKYLNIPYYKYLSVDTIPNDKINYINNVFNEVNKVEKGILIFDNLEDIFEYEEYGCRLDVKTMLLLRNKLFQIPLDNCKLLIVICSTKNIEILNKFSIDKFDIIF